MKKPNAGFIREYHDAMEPHNEAPSASWLGGGLAILSACLGPQLQTRYVSALVPNQVGGREFGHVWVLILGPSAAARKSTVSDTVRSALNLVIERAGIDADRRIRTRSMPAGRLSDAGLVRMLAAEDEEEATDWWLKGPPGYLLDASEVADLFGSPGGREDSYTGKARTVLLRAFDGNVSSETVETKVPYSPCSPTIFANATKAGIEERLKGSTIASGFFSRWVPIEAKPGGKAFAIPERTDAVKRLDPWWPQIARAMRDGGVVRDCWELYDKEAVELRESWYQKKARLELEAFEGEARGDPVPGMRLQVFQRWQATAHKLAVLHAASQQLAGIERLADLRVGFEDVAWGCATIEDALETMDALLEGAESAPTAHRKEEERIVRAVKKRGGVATVREVRRSTGMSTDEVRYMASGSDLLGVIDGVRRKGVTGRASCVVYDAEELDEQAARDQWEPAE